MEILPYKKEFVKFRCDIKADVTFLPEANSMSLTRGSTDGPSLTRRPMGTGIFSTRIICSCTSTPR